jgi:hypothetical protein
MTGMAQRHFKLVARTVGDGDTVTKETVTALSLYRIGPAGLTGLDSGWSSY